MVIKRALDLILSMASLTKSMSTRSDPNVVMMDERVCMELLKNKVVPNALLRLTFTNATENPSTDLEVVAYLGFSCLLILNGSRKMAEEVVPEWTDSRLVFPQ